MVDKTRRQLLAFPALAQIAGAAGTLWADDTSRKTDLGDQARRRFAAPVSGREKVRRRYLPNLPLVTHEGKKVVFYDDLVKGKIVTINFFYTHCEEICPRFIENLDIAHKLLDPPTQLPISTHS